jgi:hypothetical protein
MPVKNSSRTGSKIGSVGASNSIARVGDRLSKSKAGSSSTFKKKVSDVVEKPVESQKTSVLNIQPNLKQGIDLGASSNSPSKFGGKNIGGTKALEEISNKKPGYGQDIRRIKEAYPNSHYKTDTQNRDYRNSIPRGYRDYMEKTMSQPPTSYRPTRNPSIPKPSPRFGLYPQNVSGQIVGDINSTFAADFQNRIKQKAIDLAGGVDKWNQLSPEEQRQFRLEAGSKVTPYLPLLIEALNEGKKAFDRLWDKMQGGHPKPFNPRLTGLGQGLKPLVDALKPRSPLDGWENPYHGKTPQQALDEWEGRHPEQDPHYLPPTDPEYKPIANGIPIAPPTPNKPPDHMGCLAKFSGSQ